MDLNTLGIFTLWPINFITGYIRGYLNIVLNLRIETFDSSYFPACLDDIPVQLGERNGHVCHLSPKQACEADVAVTREQSTKLV